MSSADLPSFKVTLSRLVSNYHENLPRFQAERFDEASLRIDYLGPFFKALGWDMENDANLPQSLRDVQVEKRFYDDKRKRADYVFRTDGIDRLVCEAKGPLEDLRAKGAYQAQRYAYNLGVRVATLTNFTKFQLFILGGKPTPDVPWEAWKEWHYSAYEENAEELWNLFSREHVARNGLEEMIAGLPKRAVARAGRQGWLIDRERVRPVDADFLDYMEGKRVDLANDLLRKNPQQQWNDYDLNEAAQRILNQVLFIRISEDRDIDTGRLLENVLQDWLRAAGHKESAYAVLVKHFRSLDRTFNGSLFKQHFSDELVVSDSLLLHFIEELSKEDSPYLFSTLPIEILGSVYERFLGKTLRIERKRVLLEMKPELRKAGGIYYTPRFVVDYIVDGALSPKLKGKSPIQTASIKVIDISCGSGSFLISAFQRLCDHTLVWYQDHPKQRDKRNCYEDAQGELRLTTHAKQTILLNNIFGVDLDFQAVEITQFSLYLKLLEGETKSSLLSQHLIPGLETEKYLPSLEANIQAGNSLIGEDYYLTNLTSGHSDEYVHYAVKPFEWRSRFADVAKAGGFDIVIGNPPYRRELNHKEAMQEIADGVFGQPYSAPRMDLWYYFFHRGLEMLRPEGTLGFITNAYWTASTGAKHLIKAFRTETNVEEIFHLEKLKVFDGVAGQHMMFRVKKTADRTPTLVRRALGVSTIAENYIRGIVASEDYEKPADAMYRSHNLDLERVDEILLAKISKHTPLGSMGSVRQGIAENPSTINKRVNERFGNKWVIGQGVFVLSAAELSNLKLNDDEKSIVVPYHEPSDLGRYFSATVPAKHLIYSTWETYSSLNQYPQLRDHLKPFAPIMKLRRETLSGSNEWWHLHWPRSASLWESDKVICLQMESRPSFVQSDVSSYVPFSVNVFVASQTTRENLKYVTALLNSRTLWKWFHHNAKRRGIALEINGGVLDRAPIRQIDFNSRKEIAIHDLIVSHVTRLQKLARDQRRHLSASKNLAIASEVEAVDKALDALVEILYGLSEAESKSLADLV